VGSGPQATAASSNDLFIEKNNHLIMQSLSH
jgi:hypothetical protein